MPVSMYSVSIPVFMQHLNGLSGVLDKAAAWEMEGREAAHVDHVTDDLTGFLRANCCA